MTDFIWKNRIAWLIVIVVVGVALDQGTKIWALDALTRPATTEEIAFEFERSTPAFVDLKRAWRPCLSRHPKPTIDCSTPEAAKALAHIKEVERSPNVTSHGQRVVEQTIPVVDGLFNFKYAENPAAAFSISSSMPDWFRRPFLLIISTLASLGIAFWYLKIRQADWAIMTAFPLIIAGAVGNLIDRARLAYVIDFLDAYVASPESVSTWLIQTFRTNHWPTFNIADACIVAGAGLVIFRTFKNPPKPAESAADAAV